MKLTRLRTDGMTAKQSADGLGTVKDYNGSKSLYEGLTVSQSTKVIVNIESDGNFGLNTNQSSQGIGTVGEDNNGK